MCFLVAFCCRWQGTGVWQLGFLIPGHVAIFEQDYLSSSSNMGAGEAMGLCNIGTVSLKRRLLYVRYMKGTNIYHDYFFIPIQEYQYTMRPSSASFAPSSVFAGFFSPCVFWWLHIVPIIPSFPPTVCLEQFKRPHFLAFLSRQSSISRATTISQNPFTHFPTT